MVKYSVKYAKATLTNTHNNMFEWIITEESEAEHFSTSQHHPVGILGDLLRGNYLDSSRPYSFIEHRHHSVVIDSITQEPILTLEEVEG